MSASHRPPIPAAAARGTLPAAPGRWKRHEAVEVSRRNGKSDASAWPEAKQAQRIQRKARNSPPNTAKTKPEVQQVCELQLLLFNRLDKSGDAIALARSLYFSKELVSSGYCLPGQVRFVLFLRREKTSKPGYLCLDLSPNDPALSFHNPTNHDSRRHTPASPALAVAVPPSVAVPRHRSPSKKSSFSGAFGIHVRSQKTLRSISSTIGPAPQLLWIERTNGTDPKRWFIWIPI